jgi:Protein of unknown function (DUF1036)
MTVKVSVCSAAALFGATAFAILASQDRPVLIDSALAQPGKPTPTFDVYLCNQTKKGSIYVATIGIQGDKLQAKGWVNLEPKECKSGNEYTKIGTFGRPNFWWLATDGDGTWGSPDAKKVQVCVNLNDNFDFTWDGKARDCKAGEQLADFNEEKVEDSKRQWGTRFVD